MRFTIAFVLLAGCGGKHVVRNASTFQTEVLASLARQEEAASALFAAADKAKAAGDTEACVEYAGPALLIDASAQSQAFRALWLAGLPYPVDGEMPPTNTKQPDPGPSKPLQDAAAFCEE